MVLTRKTALTCVLERKIETGHRAHRKQSHGENGLFSGPFQPPNQAPGALGLRRALGTAARLLQPMLSVPSNRGAATELWFPKAASLAFSRDDAITVPKRKSSNSPGRVSDNHNAGRPPVRAKPLL